MKRTLTMTKRKNKELTPGEQITQQILSNYDIRDAQDVQNVLKQIFAPIFESMLKGEIENHLGYVKHERSEDSSNARNGYSAKTLKTTLERFQSVFPVTVKAHLNHVL